MSEILEQQNVLDHFSKTEEGSYSLEALVDAAKLEKIDHDLSETHNFNSLGIMKKLKNLISRKNIIYYGLIQGEEAIKTSQTSGDVKIPVINKDQIFKILKKLDPEKAKKIAYIHVSTIQMIMKSTFMKGINCNLSLTLRDDRMTNPREAIIAEGSGNLAHGVIKFDLNHQVGMSLKDKNLDESVSLTWELDRPLMMKEGNHPFTVTWCINYALTNSHHSLGYKTCDKIEIDNLFTPIVHLESPRCLSLTSTSSRIKPNQRLLEIEPRQTENRENAYVEQALIQIQRELGLQPTL